MPVFAVLLWDIPAQHSAPSVPEGVVPPALLLLLLLLSPPEHQRSAHVWRGCACLQGCLTRDPHCRMTVEEALVHPWLHRLSSSSVHPPARPGPKQQQKWQQQGAPAVPSNNIVSKGTKTVVSAAA